MPFALEAHAVRVLVLCVCGDRTTEQAGWTVSPCIRFMNPSRPDDRYRYAFLVYTVLLLFFFPSNKLIPQLEMTCLSVLPYLGFQAECCRS